MEHNIPAMGCLLYRQNVHTALMQASSFFKEIDCTSVCPPRFTILIIPYPWRASIRTLYPWTQLYSSCSLTSGLDWIECIDLGSVCHFGSSGVEQGLQTMSLSKLRIGKGNFRFGTILARGAPEMEASTLIKNDGVLSPPTQVKEGNGFLGRRLELHSEDIAEAFGV